MTQNKNLKVILAILVALIIVGGAYFTYTNYFTGKSEVQSKDIYTCTMHPWIVSDKPGKCPVCGMDLVLKSVIDKTKVDDKRDEGDLHNVKLSPSEQVLANVQTEKVKTMEFSGEKTFNGYVKINEKNFAHISTAVPGKIVNMFVNFEGQYVSKGQAVFEIYSPEMVSTEKEYLLALDNLEQVEKSGNTMAIDQAQSLVQASAQKLMLWEFSPSQFEELKLSHQARTTYTEYSKFSGVVTKKYVHVGHWASAGEDIYDVADLSTIWVIASVYESDMQYIKSGQTVEVTSGAYPNDPMVAKINYIDPIFNPDSRTLEARIDVGNKDLKLKPDMYVKVKVNTYAGQMIAVPQNAVLRTGDRNIVYIEREKGVYEPRDVSISYEQGGYYAVTSGLKEGETVVSSGGFLIDSETQIKMAGTQNMEGMDMNKTDEPKINKDQDIMKDMK